MKRVTEFLMNADRYQFDFGECSASNGFAQIDTTEDAWYYGTWANPYDFTFVSYAEGDLTRETAESVSEFVNRIRQFHQWALEMQLWKGIDPGIDESAVARWNEIGLGDLLH